MIERESIHHAVQTAAAVILATFIAFFLHFEQPFWAAISAIIVCNPSLEYSLIRGLMRIAGTFAGAAIGYFLAGLCANNLFLFLTACFLCAAIGIYLCGKIRYPYSALLASMTALLVMGHIAVDPGEPFFAAIWRATEITVGVIAAFICLLTIFPLSTSARAKAYYEKQMKSKIKLSDTELLQLSIKAGLSIALAMYLWLYSDWPGGLQGLVTSIILMQQPGLSDVRFTAGMRILGCIVGGGVGLATLYLLDFNIIVLIWALFGFAGLFAYINYGESKYTYAALQANIALAMTLIQTDGPPDSIALGLERLSGMILGIVSSMLIGHLVWPHVSRPASSEVGRDGQI